jgi:hypothetical protein
MQWSDSGTLPDLSLINPIYKQQGKHKIISNTSYKWVSKNYEEA